MLSSPTITKQIACQPVMQGVMLKIVRHDAFFTSDIYAAAVFS